VKNEALISQIMEIRAFINFKMKGNSTFLWLLDYSKKNSDININDNLIKGIASFDISMYYVDLFPIALFWYQAM